MGTLWNVPVLASDKPINPAFGPRLLYYPLTCEHERQCRITCYQAGRAIVDREAVTRTDRLHLVVSASRSDEIVRQWLEIRDADGTSVQTILLAPEVVCDLEGLSVNPPRLIE